MCTGKRQTHIRNAPLPRTAVTGIDPYSRRREPWGQMLFSKIRLNLFHPCHLVDGEGTSAVAVTALQAVRGGLFERQIVLLRQHVAQPGQVIIFVDEADIQPRRTGVAVLQYTHVPFVSFGVRVAMTE